MKKIITLISSVILALLIFGTYEAAAAQEVYIVEASDGEEFYFDEQPEAVLELCNFAWSGGIDPEFPIFETLYIANTYDLYSVQTQAAQGRVVNNNVRKVGHMVSCYGDMTGPGIIPPVYGAAPEFPNGPFSGDINVASKTKLNGEIYYGTGSLRIRTVPPNLIPGTDIPYPGFYLVGGTTTLHKLLEGNALEIIGAATNNIAAPLRGYPTSESPKATFIFRVADSGYIAPPISP